MSNNFSKLEKNHIPLDIIREINLNLPRHALNHVYSASQSYWFNENIWNQIVIYVRSNGS